MPNKDETSKTRKILKQLQKNPANKRCADCGSKQPTWASTNLGVFICIRCASVHRSMGTHISKVKSAKLDNWKIVTVENFRAQGGNQRVNTIHEARLPYGQKPDSTSDMYLVERFIRDKYERKMWFSEERRQNKKKSKESLSSSDESSCEDDSDSFSSEAWAESPNMRKKKKKKLNKKTGKRKNNLLLKDEKNTDEKLAETIGKEKERKKRRSKSIPPPSSEPVIDILDVSVLSFGDELESEKNTGFWGKSFVDELLSSESFSNKPKASTADLEFGEFLSGPLTSHPTSKISVSESSVKPSSTDILGMFKNKPPAMEVHRSGDIFGNAGQRAQPMPPIGVLGPQIPRMMTHQPPMLNAQFGFQPVNSQSMMYDLPQLIQSETFERTASLQRGQSNISSNTCTTRTSPLPFSNPKPQSSAFDQLMSGGIPMKPQQSSTNSSSRYIQSKPSGQSMNINLNGWMS